MEHLKQQTLDEQPTIETPRERERKTRGILSQQILGRENRAYANTGGISQNNHSAGFVPGYMDVQTGETVISRFADGRPSPVHTLDGLPVSWIALRDAGGRVLATREGIIAGFIHSGCFYTRAEAAEMLKH